MHTEQFVEVKNVWKEIEKAVHILSMCRSYTQTYNVPDEQWVEYITDLSTLLQKDDIPESAKRVIEALLQVCPHGGERKQCQTCWDKSMEWV